jgi:hypothetical protein
LEALSVERLQGILREAIDAVLDYSAYEAEIEAEKKDAAFLEAVRRRVHATLKDIDFGANE